MTLKTDVVVIANGMNIVSPPYVVIQSNNSTLRKLWLIVPDATGGNHAADCPRPPSGGVTIGNNTTINSTTAPVAAMLYSPCTVGNNGFTWNGQLYVSSFSSNTGIALTPVALGLPGQNLDDPDNPPPGFPGTGVLGNRSSMRDLAGG
jgi:hypothetical protein